MAIMAIISLVLLIVNFLLVRRSSSENDQGPQPGRHL
jgi:hypothetical protein